MNFDLSIVKRLPSGDVDMAALTGLVGERYAAAIKLRIAGGTYACIGGSLGVTTERARQMVISAVTKMKNEASAPMVGLSVWARNCLASKGYESMDRVIDGIRSGVIRPNAGIPNYGAKTHDEVCK